MPIIISQSQRLCIKSVCLKLSKNQSYSTYCDIQREATNLQIEKLQLANVLHFCLVNDLNIDC